MSGIPDNGVGLNRQAGVSLLELVATLVVAALLATLAVPSLRTYVQDTRIATLANDVVAFVHDARSEAATAGVPIVICPTQDGVKCAGSWQDGWLSFVDLNNNGTRDVTKLTMGEACDPAIHECSVRHYRTSANRAVLTSLSARPSFGFSPAGFLNGGAETFDVCIDGASSGRRITIQASGQLAVSALGC